MAIFKGYADDSRPNERVWAIGGYVANEFQWEDFQRNWPSMLAHHGVPYLHMREMAKPTGVYKKWHPPKDHEPEQEAFFKHITKFICDYWLRGFFSITRVSDLNRFNSETGLKLDPYALAAYGCMLMIAGDYQYTTAEIVFDHVEKVSSKFRCGDGLS
jgi:hypothetical protein